MYRMLVVDDEPEIVESLYELFLGEESLQLDILKTYSSKEAISIVNTVKIDILLTDIRMPGVNGLQLAETARNNWPKCRVIFLTGYNEFEYAYTAIKGDCEDYILKTESNREIVKTIESTLSKLERSFQDEKLVDKASKQIKLALPWLQKDYIMDAVNGVIKPIEISQEKLDELEIGLDINSRMFILLGRLDELPKIGANALPVSEYMITLKLIIEESLSHYSHKAVVGIDSTGFICLIQGGVISRNMGGDANGDSVKDFDIIKGAVETIQNICRKTLNTTVSFAMNNDSIDWIEMRDKYEQLKKILDFSSGIGREAFLTDKSFSNGIFERISSVDNELMENEISNIRNINNLANHLERGMREEYFQSLSQTLDCLRNVKSKNNNLALEVYYTVSNCLLSYINRWKIADIIAFKAGLYKLTRVDEHNSWNEAVDYIYKLSNEIFNTQKSDQDKMAAASVKYIQHHIQAHLNEELSLTKLAELVYFNPSYLSRLFKQVTGMNISDYIIEARITKAKMLLGQTDLKIHELVEMLGLGSPTYFGRIFKKATNMTPQEYRESCYKR